MAVDVFGTFEQFRFYVLAIHDFAFGAMLPIERIIDPAFNEIRIRTLLFNCKFSGPRIVLSRRHAHFIPVIFAFMLELHAAFDHVMPIRKNIGGNKNLLVDNPLNGKGATVELRQYIFNYNPCLLSAF